MGDIREQRAGEWKAHWPLALVAFCGYAFPAVAIYAIGLFIEPLTEEFGWSRTEVTLGLTVAGLISIPLSPMIGGLLDRWGVRRIALPGILLISFSLASFSLADGSISQWMVLWLMYSLVSLMVKTTIWTTAISNTFRAGVGFALAVTLSGTALAQIVVPPLARWLIESFGWRQAFMAIGFGWGLPTLILALFFLFDARDRQRLSRQTSETEGQSLLRGLSFREALRNAGLIRVGLATLITLTLTNSVLVHQVPLLTEAGIERSNAAYLASLAGVAAIAGKFTMGWLMDRFHAGLMGSLVNTSAALAFVLLLEQFRSLPGIIIAILIFGFGSGCKLQICAHLTSIYGGLRNYGKIFGVMASLIALSSGVGPTLGGIIYDNFGSYNPLFIGAIPASLISGILLLGLGPYPNWSSPDETRKDRHPAIRPGM